jgi:phosphomannomutase
MASFVSTNKKYNLSILPDRVVGKVGFSFTSESFSALLNSIINYMTANQVSKAYCGYDGSLYSKEFASVAAQKLAYYGIKTAIVDRPCSHCEAAWLPLQTKGDSLGLYLTADCYHETILSLMLFNKETQLVSKELNKVFKHSSTIKTSELEDFLYPPEPESLNIEGYLMYLKDTEYLVGKLFDTKKTVNIDCMFGAGEYLLRLIREGYNNKLNLFNLQSSPPRLLGYYPKPTGDKLKWYTTFGGVTDDQYFFALDGDANQLGVYDLKLKTEVSPSGIVMLLLQTFYDPTSRVIILSRHFHSRVYKYARKLKFKVLLQDDCDPKDLKENTIFRASADGVYTFDGELNLPGALIAASKIVFLCEKEKASPGELVSRIIKQLKSKETVNTVTVTSLTRSEITTYLTTYKSFEVSVSKQGVTNLSNKSLEVDPEKYAIISLKENKIEGIVEVTLESKNLETCNNLTKDLLQYANSNNLG